MTLPPDNTVKKKALSLRTSESERGRNHSKKTQWNKFNSATRDDIFFWALLVCFYSFLKVLFSKLMGKLWSTSTLVRKGIIQQCAETETEKNSFIPNDKHIIY